MLDKNSHQILTDHINILNVLKLFYLHLCNFNFIKLYISVYSIFILQYGFT